MSKSTGPSATTSAAAEPLGVHECALHTVYEGTAAQLIAAGVLPQGYKFPKRSRDVEFIAENGYEYTVAELWAPRGRYEVHIAVVAPFIEERTQHLTQGLLDICSALAEPERMAALITGVLAFLQALPSRTLTLVQVSGSSENLETLRFRVEGPNLQPGEGFYSLKHLMRQYVIEAAMASGELKPPADYLYEVTPEKTPPAHVSAKRRAVARLLQSA